MKPVQLYICEDCEMMHCGKHVCQPREVSEKEAQCAQERGGTGELRVGEEVRESPAAIEGAKLKSSGARSTSQEPTPYS